MPNLPSYSGKGEIVAKLTQSLYRLLFFCNLLLPENGEKKMEQNANQLQGNPGKIGGKVFPTKNDIPSLSPRPRMIGHAQ